jgi:hypothetical protein
MMVKKYYSKKENDKIMYIGLIYMIIGYPMGVILLIFSPLNSILFIVGLILLFMGPTFVIYLGKRRRSEKPD